jgi:hypothetical protein
MSAALQAADLDALEAQAIDDREDYVFVSPLQDSLWPVSASCS